MKKHLLFLALPLLLLAAGCNKPTGSVMEIKPAFINQATMDKVIKQLTDSCGEASKARIERGVKQVASLWEKKDGEQDAFTSFCTAQFIADTAKLNVLFNKLQRSFEVLYGNYNKMGLDLRIPVDLSGDELTPIDEMFGSFSPSSHLTDDLFANKIAFITMLNFPFYTLNEKTDLGAKWSRRDWAYARMGDAFTSRVPAALNQQVSDALAKSDMYISEYNIMMDKLVDASGKTYFPEGMKLITHWGLRDELKSHYGQADGLAKQKMVYSVMKRIIDQSIPEMVINNAEYQWNPADNKVLKEGKEIKATAEPDRRYEMLLNNFKAVHSTDAYYPALPTYSQRAFELNMEIPEKDVEKLFTSLMTSPEIKEVAGLISKRLGRNLEPFDIWYDGFKARSGLNEDDLTIKTQTLYPNPLAFEKDMPNMLRKLGWSAERASYIASKIQVDPARGSGHAAGAAMKGDKARLRTRITDKGMNYKGYNIAVHEFGHNVEQTIDLYDIDYYMLQGVPNTSFTEALAFLFQKRDLGLLGIKDSNPDKEHLLSLDAIWSCYEIMGVSLLDMQVWRWLYTNPDATPAQLKEAVIRISKEVWNQYYAPVFGSKDEPILAIYSHMIDNPLYLSNYPVGHLIDFQIDGFIKGKNFASEVDRIYTLGRLTPQAWMQGAVGTAISIDPMLKSVDEALKVIK
ncbi:MAG: hypothetical protein Q7U54_08450 [Bacteroidales bacterium]|nr:hypothetical protein [Bacteroidales bacterium]